MIPSRLISRCISISLFLITFVGCSQSAEPIGPPFSWHGQSTLTGEGEPTNLEAWMLIESKQVWPAQVLLVTCSTPHCNTLPGKKAYGLSLPL